MNQPAPSLDLKMRILRSVDAIPVPTRATETLRAVWINGAALLAALGVYCYFGGIRITGRPTNLVVGTAVGSTIIATAGLNFLARRNRTMLGRPRLWLFVVAALLPLALLAWKVGYSAQFPQALDRWSAKAGYRCLGLSLGVGLLPLLTLLYSRRGTDPSHPNTAGMALGVSIGLAVAVLIDLWCPVACLPHLLLGHLLPIGIFALLGFAVGRKLLRA
jgi:hypothetical protein